MFKGDSMIGIAIINYNSFEKTIECVESIRKTTNIPYKIFLLDNASVNESAKILSEHFCCDDDIELIVSKENLGYAKGNNLCIDRMIEENIDYGIISNNDIICTKNVIDNLIDDLKNNDSFLLVGPRMESPSGEYQKTIKLKECGKLEYLQTNTYLANLHKKKLKKEMDRIKSIKDFCEVKWVSGAFFAFSVKKMQMIGKFDSNTFLYYEESVLAKRAEKKGFLLGYNPNLLVKHYHSYSTGGWMNINSKIAADTSERYYQTNYTNNGKIFLFLLRMIRRIEVIYSFGKKRDYNSIKCYNTKMKERIKKNS